MYIRDHKNNRHWWEENAETRRNFLQGFSQAVSSETGTFDIVFEEGYYRVYKLFLENCWHCVATFHCVEGVKNYFQISSN